MKRDPKPFDSMTNAEKKEHVARLRAEAKNLEAPPLAPEDAYFLIPCSLSTDQPH